jgi:hypothetical protein
VNAQVFLLPDVFVFAFLCAVFEFQGMQQVVDHANVDDRYRKFDVPPVPGAFVSIVSTEGTFPVPDAPEPWIPKPVCDWLTVMETPWFSNFDNGSFFYVGPD